MNRPANLPVVPRAAGGPEGAAALEFRVLRGPAFDPRLPDRPPVPRPPEALAGVAGPATNGPRAPCPQRLAATPG